MKVFYLNTDKFTVPDDVLKEYLTDRKFASEEKEKQHCYGRFLVKKVAKEFYNLENTELEVVNKKPRFQNSDLHFSISHSENIILAAFDKNPVGADVEIMKERNFKELFARYNYKGEDISKELFYQFWTQYEAGIKLQGTFKTKISQQIENNFMLTVVGNFDDNYEIIRL